MSIFSNTLSDEAEALRAELKKVRERFNNHTHGTKILLSHYLELKQLDVDRIAAGETPHFSAADWAETDTQMTVLVTAAASDITKLRTAAKVKFASITPTPIPEPAPEPEATV